MGMFHAHYVVDIRCFLEVNWNVKVKVILPVTLSHGFPPVNYRRDCSGFPSLNCTVLLVLDIENYYALRHCPNFTFPSSTIIGKHYPTLASL